MKKKCKRCGIEPQDNNKVSIYFIMAATPEGVKCHRVCSKCLSKIGAYKTAMERTEFWKQAELSQEEIIEEGINDEFVRNRELN